MRRRGRPAFISRSIFFHSVVTEGVTASVGLMKWCPWPRFAVSSRKFSTHFDSHFGYNIRNLGAQPPFKSQYRLVGNSAVFPE